MALWSDMTQNIEDSADEVFAIVARCFARGGTDKNAKDNVKNVLRQLWQTSRRATCVGIGDRLKNIGTLLIDDKWK